MTASSVSSTIMYSILEFSNYSFKTLEYMCNQIFGGVVCLIVLLLSTVTCSAMAESN